MSIPTIQQLASWLDTTLAVKAVDDYAFNGLQVMGQGRVKRIAVAVDAALATIQAAAAAHAQLLLVHHGLYWGRVEPLTGNLYQRVRVLLENGMALYASHLPLDRHPRLGNNRLLAVRLGLTQLKPFGYYRGSTIGFGGQVRESLALPTLAQRLSTVVGTPPRVFPFGKKKVKRIAVVSGGAGDMVDEAAQGGYDAFITGEASHQVIHPCQEYGMNLLLGGHYATETLGIRALGQTIQKKFNIQSVFLDFPTGL